MAQEFLPKDIKTYPEATSLEGINLFGHNVATGAGENLPGSKIQEAIDNAIEGIGKPLTYKGGATVAQLNAGPSGLDSGWVYTCTTAGTLTAGSVEVEIGDEVAWNGTAWVKIGGEGGKAFVVTYDGTDGDKTQLEIYAAMSAGKVCLLYDSDWTQFAYGGLIGSGDTIYFYTTRPGSEGLTCTEYSVTSSDVWTRRQISNPGEAPVDNKAYGRWNGTWKEVSLSTPIVQGTVTGGVGQAQLYAMTDFGSLNLSGGVLTINFGSPLSGVLAEGAAEFSLTADNSVGDLVVKIGGNSDCQIINAPASGSWKAGKCYQVTMVDGYCVVGEFPIRTWGLATIGGRTYKTVTIGTQTWLAENLDYKWDGLTIAAEGVPATPAAWYYNNDETTYGKDGLKYGLLYNWYAVKYIEDNKATLCPGWHVPTASEWNALATAVGGASTAGTKLKSTTGWSSGAGTDVYGFSVFPTGDRSSSGSFSNVGGDTSFWADTVVSSSTAYRLYFSSRDSMESYDYSKKYGYSVRLVKDA